MINLFRALSMIYMYSIAVTYIVLLPSSLRATRQEKTFIGMLECIKWHLFLSLVPIANIYLAMMMVIEWVDNIGKYLDKSNK